jgi:hypothetical protein
MAGENLALVRGIDDTRATLARWNREPWPPLRGWLLGALAITVALLAAVGVIASITTPDDTPILLPGLNAPGDLGSVLEVLRRNALVLALHGFACVAGFIAGSSMPLEAERYSGLVKKVHDAAGPLAIAFVGAATAFSLITQAYVLGGAASTLAARAGCIPCSCSWACSRTRCPSSSRCSSRSRRGCSPPAGGLARAARGDDRHLHARRPGARRRGVRGGLRLPDVILALRG